MSMGGAGTSSNPSGGNAQVYIPQGQASLDQAYQGQIGGMIAQGTGAQTGGPGAYYPYAMSAVGQGYLQNPYFPQAQASAQQVSNVGGGLLPFDINAVNQGISQLGTAAPYGPAQYLANQGSTLGNQIYGGAESLMPQVQNNPYYQQAVQAALTGSGYGAGTAANMYGGLSPFYQGAAALPGVGQQTAAGITGQIPALQGYQTGITNLIPGLQQQQGVLGGYQQAQAGLGGQTAGMVAPTAGLASQTAGLVPGELSGIGPLQTQQQVLAGLEQPTINAGFDPQQALYNQQSSNALNQQNAINAMSGVAGTPYGANVTGQSQQLFNQNWLNQQLGRETQAAQTVGGLASGIGGLGSQIGGLYSGAGNLYGQAGNLYGQAGSLAGAASGMYGQAAGTGMDIGTLTGQQGSLYGQAAGIGMDIGNLYGQGQQAQTTGYQGGLNLLQGAGQTGGQAANLENVSGAYPGQTYTSNLANILSQLQSTGALGQQGLNYGFQTSQAPQQTAYQTLQDQLGIGTSAGTQAAQAMGLATAPYSQYQGAMGGQLSAISNLNNLYQNQYQLPQQTLEDIQKYLAGGQNAAELQAQIQRQNAQSVGGGIGGLLGGVGTLAGAIFGGPAGGAAGGFLGNLFGGGSNAGSFDPLFSGVDQSFSGGG